MNGCGCSLVLKPSELGNKIWRVTLVEISCDRNLKFLRAVSRSFLLSPRHIFSPPNFYFILSSLTHVTVRPT